MVVTDTIADMLTTIRNGLVLSKKSVHTPSSKLKLNILKSTKESIDLLGSKIENINIENILSTKGGHIVDISYKQEEDPRESIFKYAVKNKWILIGMNNEKANLETIFRKLTN